MGDLMRVKSLATWTMLALAAVLLTMAPAEAASRREPAQQHRTHATGQRLASNTPHRTAPAPVARSGQRAHVARSQLAAPVRGQLAVTRDRHSALSTAQSCRSSRRGACTRGPAMSWTRGLEPAAGIQANECPDGTMATPARGHENIVRCMPI